MALTFADVETFLKVGLATKGYSETLPLVGDDAKPMPLIDPGPFAIPTLRSRTPGPMIFATVGNGAGLTLEQTYDQVFVTVRVLGPQNDYASTERLAYDIDGLFLALNANGTIGSTRVLYVVRTGGAPQLVDLDDSDRYHFQTTYITPAATGL